MRKRPTINSVLAIILALIWPVLAYAHPGRLDEDGCHEVHEDYEYDSGKVLKKGTHHCHRPLDKMRLDGKEQLDDPKDQGITTKDKRRIERRGNE
jgi:hypothetical protein